MSNSSIRGFDPAALIHATLQAFQMRIEDAAKVTNAILQQRDDIVQAGQAIGSLIGEIIENVLAVKDAIEGKPATRGLNPYHSAILEQYQAKIDAEQPPAETSAQAFVMPNRI